MRRLTLFIPGLLGAEFQPAGTDFPVVARLDTLLSRAAQVRTDYSGFTSKLFNLFGLNRPAQADYPVAAAARAADDARLPGGFWMRADPVHLSAGRGGLVLFDHTAFGIDQHDALAAAKDIRSVFESKQMSLEVPVPDRWYIRMQGCPAIETSEITNVVGRNIQPYLPSGDDRTEFMRLLNEVQMTLHDAEINIERQRKGLLPVNGVWLWGAGQLSGGFERKWSRVYTDEEVARGLSILSGTPVFELPQQISEIDMQFGNLAQLVVISDGLRHIHYRDLEGWKTFLQELETRWFTGLYKLLGAGVFHQLEIITERLSFTLHRFSLLKFWRTKRIRRLARFGMAEH